ncbi:TetR/AcrR family transcriptional regulator [Phytoactinopolyspora endophytica]|uniref:TetR/AcrR family transcriptional regulator n=1 Tax=Phytoactinopolyspora endophytica TaxID=1642495 RepID=UPI00101D3944|nr:TetR/AcrR family transcriptional regulator [Phytoactinopolyspora endophytica]
MSSARPADLPRSEAQADDRRPRVRPGRPRDDSIERRVLSAVVELLLETDDESRVTVGAITARSGVSRAALYRRWPTRDSLLAAALDSVRLHPELVDTGSLEGDLFAVFHQHTEGLDERVTELVRKRIVMGLRDPVLQRTAWEKHVSQRRVPVVAAFERAIARGEIGPETDIATCLDMLVGSAYYQFVVRPVGDPGTVPFDRTIRTMCAMLRATRHGGAASIAEPQ